MVENNIVFPNYEHSILNLVNTILNYYHVETNYKGLPELETVLQKEYKNIVLILLDGMGEQILKDSSPNDFFSQNHKDVITSVFPSTTTAAITTYYSGKPPIETGWIGNLQYFKEYGTMAKILTKIDTYTGKKLDDTKIHLLDLIHYTSIYEQIELAKTDVKAYEIKPIYCTTMSKRSINADTIDFMCDSIKALCKNDEKNFILAYNDNPDALLHKYGCKSPQIKQFIKNTEEKIEKMCEDLKDSDTLFIISADHGHKDIKKCYDISDLEEIKDCMIMPAYLEERAATFWVKEEKKEKFEQFFKTKMKNEFILLTKEELLEQHLLGYGAKHEKVDDFLGDYIAIAIGDATLEFRTDEKNTHKASHAGLTRNEMEVPLIVVDCK